MNQEQALREALQSRAGSIVDPDPAARAAAVIRQGADRRRHRRTGAAAGAIALALAAGGVYASQGLGRDVAPTPDVRGTVTASPTPTPSTLPTPVRPTTAATRVGQLPAGASISAVPRSERVRGSWRLVTARGTVMLPTGTGMVIGVVPGGDGLLALAHGADYTGGDTDPSARLLRIGASNRVRVVATGTITDLVPSPDGRQVATLQKTRTSTSLAVRDLTGAVVRSLPLREPGWSNGSRDLGLNAWTPEGIVVSASSYDVASQQPPALRVLDPATGAAQKVTGVDAVVQLGTGRVLLVRTSGGTQCFAAGASLADAEQVACSRDQLSVQPSLAGAAVVQPLDPATGALRAGKPLWLLDPDATVHRALAPAPDLVAGPMVWEAPGISLHQVTDGNGPASWVRWRWDQGVLERAAEPSGRGTVEG